MPKIGSGPIPNVGATAFEFDLPEDCPFTLSPMVGVVKPGQKTKIMLKYTAKLDEETVKEEAAKIMKRNLAEQQNKKRLMDQMKLEQESLAETELTKGKGKKPADAKSIKGGIKQPTQDSIQIEQPLAKITTPDPTQIQNK